MILSGYYYHLRCKEEWCTNTNFDPTSPIRYPKVPYELEHRSEPWKRAYLRSLDGRSYQENLRAVDFHAGVAFEMRHYALWTTEDMLRWNGQDPRILELRFEDLTSDLGGTLDAASRHLRLAPGQRRATLRAARAHDVSRMDPNVARQIEHVSFERPIDWRDHFDPREMAPYEELYGDAHLQLGYHD